MRVRLALIPLVAAAALLAGCTTQAPSTTATTPAGNGIAALSADEILAKSQDALKKAKSVHIKGDITEASTGTASASPAPSKTSVDVKFSGEDDFVGTIGTNGMDLQLIRVGKDIYLKAPDALWTSLVPAGLQAAIAQIKGKWVKFDSTNPVLSGLTEFSEPEKILDNSNGFNKGDMGNVDGKPAIALVDKKDGSKLWVSTEGEPVPLRLEGPSGQGTVNFTEYGAPVTVTAPPAAEVFDIKALMGG